LPLAQRIFRTDSLGILLKMTQDNPLLIKSVKFS
jgi:hypothetical protein